MSDGLSPDDDFIPSPLHASVSLIPTARPIILSPAPAVPAHPMLLADVPRWHMLIDIAAMGGLVILVEATVFFAVLKAYGVSLDPEGNLPASAKQSLMVPMITIRAFVLLLLVGFAIRLRGQALGVLGLSTARLGWNILIGVGGCVGLFFGGYALLLLISLAFPDFLQELQKNTDALLELLPPLTTLQSVVFMLMVGVYEEVLFRGFLLPRLRRLIGGWTGAVVLSTAVFVVLHADDQVPAALVAITGLSLAFSVLTIWRRSIVPAITAHFLFNLVQLLVINLQRGHTGA